jgi:hypothetical protein
MYKIQHMGLWCQKFPVGEETDLCVVMGTRTLIFVSVETVLLEFVMLFLRTNIYSHVYVSK